MEIFNTFSDKFLIFFRDIELFNLAVLHPSQVKGTMLIVTFCTFAVRFTAGVASYGEGAPEEALVADIGF